MSRLLRVGALAMALSLCGTAHAQDCEPDDLGGTLYGLAQDGRMTVNGTTTKTYASDFFFDVDIDDDWIVIIGPGGGYYADPPIEVEIDHPEDLWSSLDADGVDRYALQRDGRMKKNDKTAYDLPRESSTYWVDLAAADGHQYSIRNDGAVAEDARIVVNRDSDGFAFRRVIFDRGEACVLRGDGNVYRGLELDPLFTFRASADGRLIETSWTALAIHPDGGFLYALRSDGELYRGELPNGPVMGERVASLPYVSGGLLNYGERYQDLAFTPDGTWYALQGDGRVYTGADVRSPLVDLPGDANDIDRLHVDLDVLGDRWFALRSDGRVYADGNATEILDLAGNLYGSMALSSDPPTLEGDGSTKKPKVTLIKVKTVVGTPLNIPVTVSDVDTCRDELVITPTSLPPGAIWNAETESLVWDAPGPSGDYKFKFNVTDGHNTVSTKYSLKVKDPDDDPDKNKTPLVAKYDDAQAIINAEYALLILADDKDGDALTITVDESVYPFTAGATFDAATRMFRWTPGTTDQGTTTVKFKVNDGAKKETIKVKVKAKLSLLQ